MNEKIFTVKVLTNNSDKEVDIYDILSALESCLNSNRVYPPFIKVTDLDNNEFTQSSNPFDTLGL